MTHFYNRITWDSWLVCALVLACAYVVIRVLTCN